MVKDLIISLLFFSGVLVSFMLGYGMDANFENNKIVGILLASGALFGGVFVVIYKEFTK